MPFAHLKTGRFHYEVFGDKQLPAVLLIMGLGMPAAGWPRSFISMLLEKSLRVITVDNRDAGLYFQDSIVFMFINYEIKEI